METAVWFIFGVLCFIALLLYNIISHLQATLKQGESVLTFLDRIDRTLQVRKV